MVREEQMSKVQGLLCILLHGGDRDVNDNTKGSSG